MTELNTSQRRALVEQVIEACAVRGLPPDLTLLIRHVDVVHAIIEALRR